MKNISFPLQDVAEGADPLAHAALRGPGILEILADLVAASKRPLHCIQVEVTSRCAAKCIYCPHTTELRSWKSRHMQDSTLANLWPLFRATERVHLQGWGEPLLHPRFFDYVALARKAGCQVSSTSCGLHMNEEIAEAIVASGMDVLAISLAGTDEASNNARAGTSFAAVCDAVRLLQQVRKKRMGAHLEIHLAYIMLADRMEAVRRLPDVMEDLDVHAAVVSTLDYLAVPEHAALALGPQDAEKIATARPLLQEAAAKARAAGRSLHYALPGPIPCGTCREDIQNTLYVDADGAISPCIYVNVPDGKPKPLVFGNANTQNALDIWQSRAFAAFRAEHKDGVPGNLCQTCVKRFEVHS